MNFKNIYNEKYEPMESVYIPIYPTKEETKKIDKIRLDLLRTYNLLLKKTEGDWKFKKLKTDYFELVRNINEWRKENNELIGIHNKLIENVAMRVWLIVDKWHWETKNNTTNLQFPQMKNDWEYSSFTYSQLLKAHENNFLENEIRLPMIGSVKADLSKEILKRIGAIRYLSVVKKNNGYFVATDF